MAEAAREFKAMGLEIENRVRDRIDWVAYVCVWAETKNTVEHRLPRGVSTNKATVVFDVVEVVCGRV